jgi:hypothetical protein
MTAANVETAVPPQIRRCRTSTIKASRDVKDILHGRGCLSKVFDMALRVRRLSEEAAVKEHKKNLRVRTNHVQSSHSGRRSLQGAGAGFGGIME